MSAALPLASPGPTLLSADDLHLFHEGNHHPLHRQLGAPPGIAGGIAGTHFAVWAPNAVEVAVVGDWNRWDGSASPLRRRDRSGIWEGFVAGVGRGARYKYRVLPAGGGRRVDKADPV